MEDVDSNSERRKDLRTQGWHQAADVTMSEAVLCSSSDMRR